MSEPYSGMTDVALGYDTDLHFSDGDLLTTNGIDFIERECYKLLITLPGDWKSDTSIGSSPNQFLGEQNTREVAKRIERKIETELAFTVSPGKLTVRVVPTGYNKIIGFLDIYALDSNITTIPFSFDYINGFLKLNKNDPLVTEIKSGTKTKINKTGNIKRPNKYWSRLRQQR